MRVVYVAGAFRSPTHWGIVLNVRAAEALALKVWQLGCAAICPHLNTANFQGALPDQVWLDGDLEIVKRCDAVILVPGYKESHGTATEMVCAIDNGVPVFTELSGLESWLQMANAVSAK
jgi:hypothetical protein